VLDYSRCTVHRMELRMDNEIWHLTNDFDRLPAREVLGNILRDDRYNYQRAELELGEEIRLLDDATVLYVESLQAAYRAVDTWKGNDSNRAAMAMLASTLNYLLLVRHAILLGYYPEARDLLRSCFERISSCYVFFHDGEFARRFLSGEEIWPREIRAELSRLEPDSNRRKEIRQSLNKYYAFLSEVIHPNLKSFQARHGTHDLRERIGLEYVFGGLMGSRLGHATIVRALQTVLSALMILGVIVHEESGVWDAEYEGISRRCDEMVDGL
jgi:hypothetical protein